MLTCVLISLSCPFVFFAIFALKANHNKDYSVVKTFSASPICGAFLFSANYQAFRHRKIIRMKPIKAKGAI